jgi:hypothetical protein
MTQRTSLQAWLRYKGEWSRSAPPSLRALTLAKVVQVCTENPRFLKKAERLPIEARSRALTPGTVCWLAAYNQLTPLLPVFPPTQISLEQIPLTSQLVSALPTSLQNLVLGPRCSDKWLAMIASRCSQLVGVSLLGDMKVTDKGLRDMSKALTGLQRLSLETATYLTGDGIASVVEDHPLIGLALNPGRSGRTLPSLPPKVISCLESLSMEVDDADQQKLLERATRLRRLELGHIGSGRILDFRQHTCLTDLELNDPLDERASIHLPPTLRSLAALLDIEGHLLNIWKGATYAELAELTLCQAGLKTEQFKQLADLAPNLRSVVLAPQKATDEAIASLGTLSQLQYLVLYNLPYSPEELTGSCFEASDSWPALRELTLSGKLNGISPARLQGTLTRLTRFEVGIQESLTEAWDSALQKLSYLRDLHIYLTGVVVKADVLRWCTKLYCAEEAEVVWLKSRKLALPRLDTFSARKCPKELAQLLEAAPNLTKLILSTPPSLPSGRGAIETHSRLMSLTLLRLAEEGADKEAKQEVMRWLASCKHLVEVDSLSPSGNLLLKFRRARSVTKKRTLCGEPSQRKRMQGPARLPGA